MDIGSVESPHPAPPPRVAQVFVSGAVWTTSFTTYLRARGMGDAMFGYAVPSGTDQLRVLPWAGLNRVSVRFSHDVAADRLDLSVAGVNTAAYAVSDYHYEPLTRTATWHLAQPLRNDRVTLTLDADAGGVAGPSGRLDGEWAEGTDAFPSGDGAAGVDFAFRLRVLPGDADRNGTVLANDASQVKQKFFSSTSQRRHRRRGLQHLPRRQRLGRHPRRRLQRGEAAVLHDGPDGDDAAAPRLSGDVTPPSPPPWRAPRLWT